MQNERADAVLKFLRYGMEVSGQRLTSATLGNRDDYIGMSDLAKYSECPRAALASKILPPENTLSRMLVFARGHWIEEGIGECLSSCC